MTHDDRASAIDIAEPALFLMTEEERGPDGALLACLREVRSALGRERAEAPGLAAELLSFPPETREERLLADPRFQTWGLCELLLARSLEAAADPAASGELAALAVAAATRLDRFHPAPVVEDLRARAWAAAGEAWRRRGDLAAAEEALRNAAGCLAGGTGDLLVEAGLLEFEAAVRRQQGRTGEAAALFKQAAARYRQTGDAGRMGRALAERDEILKQSGVGLPAAGR
jgi:tetratricopeptide (TPR) repeat protein